MNYTQPNPNQPDYTKYTLLSGEYHTHSNSIAAGLSKGGTAAVATIGVLCTYTGLHLHVLQSLTYDVQSTL